MSDFNIYAEFVAIDTSYASNRVQVELTRVDLPDLLNQIDVEQIIQHFGDTILLQHLIDWCGMDKIDAYLDEGR